MVEMLLLGLELIPSKLWLSWQQKALIDFYNGEKNVYTLTPSVLIQSSSNLQVMRSGINAQNCLNFGQIGPLPLELNAIECLKISHRLIIGIWCRQASTFIFYRIFVRLAGNQDRHKISEEFKFAPNRISHFGVTCPWEQKKSLYMNTYTFKHEYL